MSYNSKNTSEEVQEKTRKIAEEFYGTETHPDQIPITTESAAKLDSISDLWFNCELDDQGEPISWIVVIPTSIRIMNDFVSGTITERQLFDATTPATAQEALYLCSVFTLPDYRRQGLAEKLMVQTIKEFELTGKKELFVWIYSPEGKQMVETLQKKYDRFIHIRKD